jgi:imidazole glycerol-phosphate synthase subunit HisH
MNPVTIVDYGMGNLFSVRRGLEKSGAEVRFAETAAQVEAAERLVLPGVGAFADGMSGLRERGLDDAVRRFASTGRPLLGICLGMQMLLSRSEEFGANDGLDLIPGDVVAIPATTSAGAPHKIPHIGWNSLERSAGADWKGSIFETTPDKAAVYLVHSFTAVPTDPRHRLADCHYNGRLISAAVRSGNVYGCQFHPEKSGAIGLGVLAEFVSR